MENSTSLPAGQAPDIEIGEKELLNILLNAPQIMIWLSDANHFAFYGNQAIFDYVGLTLKDLAGLQWQNAIHPEDRDRVLGIHQHCQQNHVNFRMEYRVRVANGEYRWVMDIGVPRWTADGRFDGYVGSVIDIHEQKLHELQLKKRQKLLEKEILEISDKERGRVGRELHDTLCQNLLSIALKANRLERDLKKIDSPKFEAARQVSEDINQAIREVRDIAQSLFPISLTKQGLGTALEEFRHYLEETFSVSLKTTLDSDAEELKNETALHLYRIIQEAVTNSIRHGRAKRVEIRLEMTRGQGLLSIQDDGRGFPESDTLSNSSGMGLAIMEYRARLMEGKLEFKNGPQGGARILCSFKFP